MSAFLTACAPARPEGPGGVAGLRGAALEKPLDKPSFVLPRTDGTPYDFARETAGRVTLLFFGYTHCPDVCPLHMANIAAVLRKMPWSERDAYRVVFVSTDPERDTPERIARWLAGFDPAFTGLRGSLEDVNAIQASLGIAPATREDALGGDYLVGHAAQVIAFERDGVARVAYPFGTRQEDWAHDLPLLAGRAAPVVAAEEHVHRETTVTLPAAGVRGRRALAIAPGVIATTGDGAGALYLAIRNDANEPDTLRRVALIGEGHASLHETRVQNGVAVMQEVSVLAVPARGRLEMRPGGAHVMLHGMLPGRAVAVELHFARGGRYTIAATVVEHAQLDSVLRLARSALETR